MSDLSASRILIAEDSRTQASRLRMVLEDAGYHATVAETGESALELLQQQAFDLLVSDVQMPGMSGFELCRVVKASRTTAGMPVMLLTALRDPVDIVNGLSAGADNFITKPFNEVELLRRVSMLLASRDASPGDLRLATEVKFAGRQFTITAEKQQIVNLLVSTFEEIVSANAEIEQQRNALREANDRVEEYARRLASDSDGTWRNLLQTASDGILMVDGGGQISEANSRAFEILGRRPDELLGQRLDDFRVESAADSSDWFEPPALSDGHGIETLGELTIERGDARTIRLEVTSGRLQEDTRQVRITIIRDITERHRQTRRLRQVIDAVTDSILIVDDSMRIVQCNEEARLVLTPASGILHGSDLRRILTEPDGSPLADDAAPARNRHVLASVDGADPLDMEMNTGPLTLDDVEYRVCILRDITERLRSEQRARQAQKLEAIGRLAGGVAHDFNNLLTVINGYADALLRDIQPDDERYQSVIQIRRAGDSAAAMTRQLLSVGQRDTSRPEVTGLNAIIDSLQGTLRRLLGDQNRLDLRLSDGPALVRVDRSHVEQVLLNLVVNARDAMPGGGVVMIETSDIRLGAGKVAGMPNLQPGNYARLVVSDTGLGMDAQTQRHVFEPFFTTKQPGSGSGTGLGLATVHSLVDRAGGAVNLYSEPGKGTAFHIYLPLVEDSPRVEPALPAAPVPDSAPIAAPADTTILVADDNDAVRMVTVMLLEDAGYNVLVASDGEEAIRIIREHPGQLDLVVTDVVMPHISGRELANQLRAIRPGVPVMFMSGYTERGAVQNGTIDEGFRYLQKPFAVGELLDAVRAAL
ncbi:MAG: response regulator [Planctomycetota bacterium]